MYKKEKDEYNVGDVDDVNEDVEEDGGGGGTDVIYVVGEVLLMEDGRKKLILKSTLNIEKWNFTTLCTRIGVIIVKVDSFSSFLF